MYLNNKFIIGKNKDYEACIIPKMVNRHGLITGATGSGKTTTIKVLAESFSDAGIPVLMIDVKGDVSGTCKEGTDEAWINSSVEQLGLEGFNYKKYPVAFYDVFKQSGIPLRTKLCDVNPRILSKMLGLSDAQEGILAIAYQVSKDENLELIDLDDLRQLLSYIGENKDKYILAYGNITTASVAAIQRNILELSQQGGDKFFGEPDFDLYDFMQYEYTGQGFINILDAQELFKQPTLYACVLVWLLNNLYDKMPEVGDLDRPKLAVFLDEAHLIFSEMSGELIKKITQIVKLIRSKGIGVYFISQVPNDIPEEILGQLGNKIQHVLRSYTPKDEQAIKASADSFRQNPNFDTVETIKSLGIGEAIVSFLNENGEPNVASKVKILPPQSYTKPISNDERDSIIKASRFYGKYITDVDRYSASEKVNEIREQAEVEKQQSIAAKEAEKQRILDEKEAEKLKKQKEKEEEKRKKEQTKIVKQIGNKFVNKATTKVVNSIWKGLFK